MPLADILGTSRARILRLLADPHTTAELATATNLSPGTASSHSAALRRAGLITTHRDGRSVRRSCTDLGRMLAEAGPTYPGKGTRTDTDTDTDQARRPADRTTRSHEDHKPRRTPPA